MAICFLRMMKAKAYLGRQRGMLGRRGPRLVQVPRGRGQFLIRGLDPEAHSLSSMRAEVDEGQDRKLVNATLWWQKDKAFSQKEQSSSTSASF